MISEFLQKGNYLAFPSRNSPKVIFRADGRTSVTSSMDLYTPQSIKGKLAKFLFSFSVLHFKFVGRLFFVYKVLSKGKSLESFEKRWGLNVSTAVYISTEKDKYIVKIFKGNTTFGYIKVPTNQQGADRIEHERFALKTLEKEGKVEDPLLIDTDDGCPYLLVKPLRPLNQKLTNHDLERVLNKYRKDLIFPFRNHPRVLQLLSNLSESHYKKYYGKVFQIVDGCSGRFAEVYEHGDFAIWNIGKTEDNLIEPFDFEYFVERGIEYFDLIKYHFQNLYLIRGYRGRKLYQSLKKELKFVYFMEIFLLFTLKELLNTKNCIYSSDLESLLFIES